MHQILLELVSVKFVILYILIISTIIVHYRGKVRYKFFRQLTDHSTFMAPINIPMYALSGVVVGFAFYDGESTIKLLNKK